MSIDNDGGPAFPASWHEEGAYGPPQLMSHPGMMLRDWLAGQALHAVAARWQGTIGDVDKDGAALTAVKAYMLADAMLAARSPQEKA